MKNRITVLLTSAGGITGTFLIKHLSKTTEYRIVGADMQHNISLVNQLSAFYQVPPCSDKNFIESIKEIVKKESVDVVIPVSSYDVEEFSKNISDDLLKDKMLVMPYEQHKILHDKKECYRALSSIGISIPKEVSHNTYPYLMKARQSSGGKGVVIIENKEDFLYWSTKIKDYICVEILPGDEYTVDSLFDRDGTCIGYNTRKRIRMAGGGAVVSKNCPCKEIAAVISVLEKNFELCGPINFQFKYGDGNNPIIFDVNTRLASGGLALTVASGFDIPALLIQLILKQRVERWTASDNIEGLTMYRYYEEVFH